MVQASKVRGGESLENVGQGAADEAVGAVAGLERGAAGLNPNADRFADFLAQVKLGVTQDGADAVDHLLGLGAQGVGQDDAKSVVAQAGADTSGQNE